MNDELLLVTGQRGVREYRPDNDRAWKLDIAFPHEKVAVEISGRFHLHHSQFRSDCERNNFLQMAGWKVLVYPASSINAKARRRLAAEQIWRVLCGIFDVDLDSEVLTQPLR